MRAVSMSPLPSLLLEGSTSSLRGGQGGWEGAREPSGVQILPRGQPGLRREGNQTLRPSDSGRVLSQGSVHCPPWLSA